MSEDFSISSAKAPCWREDALSVLVQLRGAGHVAYFAGGCVRDLLLGKTPKDWDVATDARPARVREIFRNTQAVGAAFGVILVREGRSTVEVATFRTEGVYSDGRRPDEVAFTDAEHDARRRDFTINGLFLDPEKGLGFRVQGSATTEETEWGTVIDYVGGMADLRTGVLRAIGDPHRRFAEDHLRLLRAVRFAARLGFAVEEETERAIVENGPKLKGISPERIAEELRMMLTPVTRGAAWRMLWQFGLVLVVFRFFQTEGWRFVPGKWILLRVAPEREISFALALAAGVLEYQMTDGALTEQRVLALTGRQEISRAGRAMREGLRISNEELDAMVSILQPLPVLLDSAEPGVAALKRFLARGTAAETRLLMGALAEFGIFAKRVAWLEGRFEELSKGEVAPLPLVNGDDLVAAGMKPGPAFKRILEAVYDAQLEGRVGTKEEGMRMVGELKHKQ